MTAARNPALLVAPGTRARLELGHGVRADVVRGPRTGPVIWLWVVRGAADPSLQQALAELRDAIAPALVTGAIGMIVDGPGPTLASWHGVSQHATAVVLLCGGAAQERVMPHAAIASGPRDRRLAAELALPIIVPATRLPPLPRSTIATAWLVAGERGRMERPAVDAAREALEALLVGLGLVAGTRRASHRATARQLIEINAGPGLAEPLVAPGALVARGQLVAQLGEPGVSRQELRAPTAGVAISVRGGWNLDGPTVTLARPPAPIAPRRSDGSEVLGWCELVDLPELGVTRLPAKIDTGARTSALHVHAKKLVGRSQGRAVWEIEVPAGDGGRTQRRVRARVEVIEESTVRDSGGHAERRPVIETTMRVGDRLRRVRVTLTDRGDMRFPMLVGRTALDANTRIDPTRAFVTRPARRASRRSPHQA